MNEAVLQSILGTDKRNPCLQVCRRQDTNKLEVYYGAQRLETVVDDKNHISYRACLGRLYNAGLNRATLSKIFDVDRKTMQRWGKALLMPDAESSVQSLRSRQEPRKLTVEVRRFAELRFEAIYPKNRYGYSSRIRREIFETFRITLSSESLRPVFAGCMQRMSACAGAQSRDGDGESGAAEQEADKCGDGIGRPPESCDIDVGQNRIPETTAVPVVRYLHHAGVLLFSSWLIRLQSVHVKGALLKQWLVMVLLEVVNIEQSKYVGWDSLGTFLGWTVRGTVEQRIALGEIGQDHGAEAVLRLNAAVTGVDKCSDFYYDPHTLHYTGMKTILKGWCSNIRWADKALHCDYLHTGEGMPVYVEYADNYQDLRERFKMVMGHFRHTVEIDPCRVVTVVMDRGIYGLEVFDSVKTDPLLELVTWEKGFVAEGFDESRCSGSYELARSRNNAADVQLYRFAYIDEKWPKDSSMRRLVVQAINPQGRCIVVSIISTDTARDAKALIRLMFRRWIQENDFKYLDKHYGINQITSYASIAYEDLKSTLTDKQMESAETKMLLSDRRACEKDLRRLLHKEHNRDNRVVQARASLELVGKKIEAVTASTTPCDADELVVLRKARSKQKAIVARLTKPDYKEQKQEFDQRIAALNEKLAGCHQQISKLDYLVAQGYERLDTNKKLVMDCIKILARNLFYQTLSPFKKSYDNYRDDHAYFRSLTHSPGLWVDDGSVVTVFLEPAMHLSPKLERCFQIVLDDLQKLPLFLPDGSGRIFQIKLWPSEGIALAVA
jgi:hypothetical protein